MNTNNAYQGAFSGPYDGSTTCTISIYGSTASGYKDKQFFSANADTYSMGNPMAGHANGDDIRPYNISMIPIIIVS